ncbi:diguanylate cyclase/phosphodiesterase with PAS/PAC sensor(s) [Gloeothece citriformis PCC 7424]|uniref:Diguanylate cyclase/phosphodiesterase with PAS/PAC sensor(S) n=1 Tax=Gloeothece citriformis (strain PCC 7424) TaxID=65393 RepID=B7KEN2_GLOC7|nr:PAS domain S-box protein [Gloeothece citriformis]ACK69057.1 diguanylate cyclase/phosphodiesterase with PAS/PAC sensor(s) [Gloeothece citriformis PCC 7424]
MKTIIKIVGIGFLSLFLAMVLVCSQAVAQPNLDLSFKDTEEPWPEMGGAIPARPDNFAIVADITGGIKPFLLTLEDKQLEGKRDEQLDLIGGIINGALLTMMIVVTVGRQLYLGQLNILKKIKQALKKSRSRYRAIVEEQTELICRFRPDGTLTFVNEAYYRYFEKTPEYLLEKIFLPLIPFPDQQQVLDNLKSLNQQKRVITHEHRVIISSGEMRWHQWTNRAIVDRQGKIIEFQAVGRDITELKQIETALRELNEELEQRVEQRTLQLEAQIQERQAVEKALMESEAKYERLVERLPAVIYQFSPTKGKLYCSSYVKSILGYSTDEIDLPWLWINSIHPEDLPKVKEMIQEFVQGKNFEIEYRVKDAQGQWHWILDRSIGRQAADQEMMIEGVAIDITETKKTQMALQQAHQCLTFHVDNSPLGVIEWDNDYRVKRWSSQAEKIFGWKEEEVVGKGWQEWQFVYEEDLDLIVAKVSEIIKKETSRHFVTNRNYTKTGEIIDCKWYNSVQYDQSGEILSILSLVLDVSEQKRAEAALQVSQERLQLALEGSGDSIWEWNLQTGEIYCDQSWWQKLGYEPDHETMSYEWWRSQVAPEFLPIHEASLQDYLAGKTEYLTLEYKIQSSSGDWVWMSARGKSVANDEEGNPLKIVGTHRDITESKEIEEELKQQGELLQTIVDYIPVMLAYIDPNYNFLWVNEEFERILGWSLEEIKNLNILAQLYPDPDERQYVMNYIQSAEEKWEDFKTRLRNGTTIDTSWANVKLSNGAIIGIGQDITVRKHIEEALRESEQKYRLLFYANPNPLWVYDVKTLAFLEVNQAAIEHYGYSREEFLGMTLRDIRPSEDVKILETYIANINPSFNRSGYWQHRKSNGEIIDVEITSHGIEFAGRQARLVLVNDITEQLKAQQKLQESENRFRRAVIDAPLPILIHAEDGEIIQVNHAWTELTGYTHEDIPTIADWTEKAYGERKEIVRSVIDELYKIDGKVEEGEFTITIKTGETRIWNFSSAPLGRLADNRRLIMSMALDITERKQAEEQLRHAAVHDQLTGLPNRILLLDRIEQAIKRTQQEEKYLFALLFIDLDRFKVVNDSLGHWVGDQLLGAIADKLKACVRPMDTVARFGGDEFVILLENLTSRTEATKMAQQITDELRSSFCLQGQDFFISVSIGITFPSSYEESASELLRNADIAMYRAKEKGRARYTIFDSKMHIQATRLLELETNLRLALEREELIVHYQPIVSLTTGKLLGFEALVRWEHPKKGLISPGEFIPIAEETGLIIPLGEWVLLESCRQMKAWQKEFSGLDKIRVSVNLSGKQLEYPHLINCLESILKQTGLEGKNLKLEITESMLMNNKEVVSDLLLQIKGKNIQISIDDFGTGYSSLSYLHYLPVDTLKIDRSFVNRMTQLGENFEIVEAIINLAHHLQMDVVAEGVETEQHIKQLKQLGCESGQGYFFSKPLDSQKVTSWFEKL